MNYIITSATNKYLPFLFEFMISLETLGRFNGKVIVLYYYESEKENLDGFKFENMSVIFKKKQHNNINNVFYYDVYDILLGLKDNDKVAIYDCDVWFQDNINELFESDSDSMFCSVEIVPKFSDLRESNAWVSYVKVKVDHFINSIEYKDKALNIIEKYGSNINGGFIFANNKILKLKMENLLQIMEESLDLEYRGISQISTNIIFDIEKDVCLMNEYNYCLTRANVENLDIKTPLMLHSKKIKVLHFNEKSRPLKVESFHDFRFHNFYPEIVHRYIQERG